MSAAGDRTLIDSHSDGAYAVLRLAGTCPQRTAPRWRSTYRLFFDLDPTHRGLLQYVDDGHSYSVIFSADARTQTLGAAVVATAHEYVHEGVWHIWLGFDHILFLLSLLLPAVLLRRDDSWQPAQASAPRSWTWQRSSPRSPSRIRSRSRSPRWA